MVLQMRMLNPVGQEEKSSWAACFYWINNDQLVGVLTDKTVFDILPVIARADFQLPLTGLFLNCDLWNVYSSWKMLHFFLEKLVSFEQAV